VYKSIFETIPVTYRYEKVTFFDEKITKIPSEIFLLIFSLDLDPDPHSSKRLDQDPHIMYADPKHCPSPIIIS
jgi:hypothetical protein